MRFSRNGMSTALFVGAWALTNTGFAQWQPQHVGQTQLLDASCQTAIDGSIRKQKTTRMRQLARLEQTNRADLVLPFKEDGSIDQANVRLNQSSGNPLLDAQLIDIIRTMGRTPACSHGPGPGPWEAVVKWQTPPPPDAYLGGSTGQKPVVPELLKQGMPEYPKAAIVMGLDGTTLISLLVAPDGSVAVAQIAKSSGSKILDNAALDAAYMSTFKPYLLDQGQKVVTVGIPFLFRFEAPPVPAVAPSK